MVGIGRANGFVSRRRFVQGTGVAALAAPNVLSAQTPETLVVNTQGGEYQEIVEATVIRPFERKFGVRVTNDATGTSAQDYARIRASRGAPGFDVAAVLNPPEILLGQREGLLERLSEREVPNLARMWRGMEKVVPPFAAPHTLQYAGLIYNKERLEAPNSWSDYWEPHRRYGDRIRGRVIAYNPANLLSVYALIHAAQLGGGSVNNMDPAWERLRAQKPFVGVNVTTSAEGVPHFENGAVWISPFWSGRTGYYIDRGLPFGAVIPREGVIGLFDCCAVPVGARNKRLAYEFCNFRLEPDVQRAFSLAYFSSPSRPDITDWPQAFRDQQILTQERFDQIQWPDSEVIGAQRAGWTRRWQDIMA